ncbi:MAG: prephenate dehydrogenase/arogenate dehydrogenase family protein, partial [Pseudomonadota bacterium]
MTIERVAIIGLGLLGGSIGLAIAERAEDIVTTGYDQDSAVRDAARTRGLVNVVCESAAEAVATADLVILCVPVGAMEGAARSLAPHLPADAIISDVGSSKASVLTALQSALPGHTVIPAHPVAGT